jgi:hypothetical protein
MLLIQERHFVRSLHFIIPGDNSPGTEPYNCLRIHSNSIRRFGSREMETDWSRIWGRCESRQEREEGVGGNLRGRGREAEVPGDGERLRHAAQPLRRLLRRRHGLPPDSGATSTPYASWFGELVCVRFAFASPAG